ncbi:PI31_Prot_N domain-containing protein, partial [Haematococcus lacustris]
MGDLTELLPLAVPKPASVGTRGAALALACHCVMVREGFTVEEPQFASSRIRRSSPPANWQMYGPMEWNFVYSHSSKLNLFKLIVSLHEKSGRAFVHCSEDLNPNNIQILGLQLENYVPETAAGLKGTDWTGIMTNMQGLEAFYLQHIVRPLLDGAEDLPL